MILSWSEAYKTKDSADKDTDKDNKMDMNINMNGAIRKASNQFGPKRQFGPNIRGIIGKRCVYCNHDIYMTQQNAGWEYSRLDIRVWFHIACYEKSIRAEYEKVAVKKRTAKTEDLKCPECKSNDVILGTVNHVAYCNGCQYTLAKKVDDEGEESEDSVIKRY